MTILLFSGLNYYPQGGMEDLLGAFETVEQCVEYLKSDLYKDKDHDWCHVYDTDKMMRVYDSDVSDEWSES